MSTTNQQRPPGSVHYDNTGRVVLVTGGAGGIGHAICDAFAESGASVISADVRHDAGDASRDVTAIDCDTSNETSCRETIDTIVERFGGLDILVNNAAIQPSESYLPIDQIERSTWDKMVAINLSGYHFMAKYALPQMLSQRSGVIINIASGQAHRTAREVGVYGPIKAANLMQTRQWGVEYARQGIRVASVSPGAIDTPMVRASLDAQGGADALANRHPIGRIGQPGEVAAAVLWLCSNAASFVTATDLEVDGGLGAFGAFADPFPIDTMTDP